MKRSLVSLMAVILSTMLLAVACAPAAPAPAPTTAPAAPKPAEPTKAAAPAAQPAAAPTTAPTAAPAAVKSDFPIKGKPITILMPFTAGGPNDIAARLLAPIFEKELGVPVEVVNKVGASSQLAMGELAKSKPDGHVIAYSSMPTSLVYLDEERKAGYGSKDLAVIAQHAKEAGAVSVKADSQFKTLKDMMEYAKANPNKVKAATNGLMASSHINLMLAQKITGVKFSAVHFDGTAPELSALLGGHVDAMFTAVNTQTVGPHKSGQLKVLGVMDKTPSKQLPDVQTWEAQGYPVYGFASYGLWGPAGLPADIMAKYEDMVKRAVETPEHQQKMSDAGMSVNFIGTKEFTTFWREQEALFTEFVKLSKQEQK